MRKDLVIEHFGSPRAVAEALDITVQAVSAWGPLVPESSAYKIESVTRRKLKVDPADYAHTTARQAKIQASAASS
jgi:hypothetical protein